MAEVITVKDEEAVIAKLGILVKDISENSPGPHFKIGVSGGSLIRFLSVALKQHPDIDFRKWVIFFCDERVVPEDDPESTYGSYKNALGSLIGEEQFVRMKQGAAADAAACDYTRQMESYFAPGEWPRFDLLLLGMGPDGHTCSLFPGHQLLGETGKWVAPITDSPKPPPSRITLTLPVLNHAKNAVFAMSGSGKAAMVKRILKDKEQLPAAMVQPTNGKLYWILDKSAASLL